MSEVNITPLGAFLLGQQLRRNLVAVREPVAYLYNGVRLPKLPEWDRETYPYAVIYQYKDSGATYCVATSEPLIINYVYCQGGATAGMAKLRTKLNEDSAWESFVEDTDAVLGTSYVTFVWGNYDVYNYNGVLKIEASDPVPVYE